MDRELRVRGALVALLLRPRASWTKITLDALECGDVEELLDRTVGNADALLPAADTERMITDAIGQIREWEADGTSVHAFTDSSYPAQLRDIHEMPPLLFTRGELSDDRRAIAVVGSRAASEHGLKVARSVARTLAEAGVTVVSGLAAGIDTAAHTAALDADGRTVAVIGTGIRRTYPRENAELQRTIERRGLVISQFLPDAPPTRGSFPMRNAVMSGYASATVVVEAGEHSGARIQARYALAHGRPVIMPDSLLSNTWAQDYARRPGVHVVHGLTELLAAAEECVAAMSVSDDSVRKLGDLAVH